VIEVKRNDGTGKTAPGRRPAAWPAVALPALGGWLVVSPLLLSTTRDTAGTASAVGGGVALIVLAVWARVARNRVPPLAIALSVGVWLSLAPSLWEFANGEDSVPGLVPIPPAEVTEPTRAAIAHAEWNSILAGLLTLALAVAALLAGRWRARSAASAGGEDRRHADASVEQR
jgi:hypothetical protein